MRFAVTSRGENYIEALKTGLTIFTIAFLTDPAGKRLLSQENCLDTLNTVVQILSPFSPPSYIKDLPPNIKDTIYLLWAYLCDRFVDEVRKCYGKSSKMASHATITFVQKVMKFQDLWRLRPGEEGFEYQRLMDCKTQRKLYVKYMNEFLEWAKLPTRTKEELVGKWRKKAQVENL